MVSLRNKIIIFLVVVLVISLFLTFIAVSIIEYNLCYKKTDFQEHCYGRAYREYFLIAFGYIFGGLFVLLLIATFIAYMRRGRVW